VQKKKIYDKICHKKKKTGRSARFFVLFMLLGSFFVCFYVARLV